MELKWKLLLMLVAAAFLCSGNLCIIASKVDGLVPYSSVSVTFLIAVLKLFAMLTAIVFTKTSLPRQVQVKTSWCYAVPALLSAIESNLNYVVLRYLDAATVSVLWNLKILLTAVLFRYVLKQPLSELHKLAIVLLILGVLTSQSDRLSQFSVETSENLVRGLSLAIVGVALSSCASVFAEWTLKKQSDCPFLWQSVQMYTFGVLFNAFGLIVDRNLVVEGVFHDYSGWTVAILVVNSVGGIFMACILKYLDNIACVYSHSMAMMFTTLLSMIFFAFSPSLEFACGLGVLVVSIYLYNHPLAQVSDTSASRESDSKPKSMINYRYKQIQAEIGESCRAEESHRPRPTHCEGAASVIVPSSGLQPSPRHIRDGGHPNGFSWLCGSSEDFYLSLYKLGATSGSSSRITSPNATKLKENLSEKCPMEAFILAGVWWNLDATHYYTVGNATVCHVVIPQYNTHGNYVIGSEKMPPLHTAPSNCTNDSFLFEIYLYHAGVGFYSFYEEEVGTYCTKSRMSYLAVKVLGSYDINGVYLAEDTGSTKRRMSYWYTIVGAVWLIYRSLTVRRGFIRCRRHGRSCDSMGEVFRRHEALVFVQESLRLSAHSAANFQRVSLLYLLIEGITMDLFLIIANDGWVSRVQYVSLGYNLSGLTLILFEALERTKWLKEKWRLCIKRLLFSYETALVGELVTALVLQVVLTRLNASDFKRSKPTALAVSYYVWGLTCHAAVVLVILSIIASVRIPWALVYVWWKHRSLAVFSAPCSVDTALGPRSRLIMLGGYILQDGKLFYKKSTLKAFGMMKVEEEDVSYLVLPKVHWISTPRDNLVAIGVISGHRVQPLDEQPCSGIATLIDHKLGGLSSHNFKASTAQVVAWSDGVLSSPTQALFPLEVGGR